MTDPADRAADRRGSVAVVGAAGGAGATTLAAGLALAWAAAGRRVWLVDLDRARGDLASAWGLPAARTIDDLARVAGEVAADHLERVATPHGSGVGLIAAPGLLGGPAWSAAAARAVCQALCAARAVVADVGPAGSLGRAMVERTDSLLLVCPATLAGARRAGRLVEGWRGTAAEERLGLVWARGRAAPEIGARALGRALRANVVAEVPWRPREAAALAAGTWPTRRRAPLAAAVTRLSQVLP